MRVVLLALTLLCCLAQAQENDVVRVLKNTGYITEPVIFKNKILFTVDHSDYGEEPWVSDGTEAGTFILSDIVSGPSSSDYHRYRTSFRRIFYISGNLAYFTVNRDKWHEQLWVTDGSQEGTRLLKEFEVGCDPYCQRSTSKYGRTSMLLFIPYKNMMFFTLQLADGSYSLWRTDGTETGTELFHNGRVISGKMFQGSLYFTVENKDSSPNRNDIWSSDGFSKEFKMSLPASTRMVAVDENYIYTLSSDKLTIGRNQGEDGTQVNLIEISSGISGSSNTAIVRQNANYIVLAIGRELWSVSKATGAAGKVFDMMDQANEIDLVGEKVYVTTFDDGLIVTDGTINGSYTVDPDKRNRLVSSQDSANLFFIQQDAEEVASLYRVDYNQNSVLFETSYPKIDNINYLTDSVMTNGIIFSKAHNYIDNVEPMELWAYKVSNVDTPDASSDEGGGGAINPFILILFGFYLGALRRRA
ncbi:hypothetical protein [Pleionea sp. CnH1-48]|uniref:hypothetical protein n=1 Tax=Pleionea sp. CnH1-48 TaxID=2954494 RepID=UPI00209755C5|nr:hypothetical protein [Pleionea sp. CnH1-48]MCO7225591.1 hypothetical protein [Pleionea sp. CnH1-48]